jgi:hypothetical protein
MSLKIHVLNSHMDFSPKIMAQWVRSKENISTKTWRKWKEDTRVGGMLSGRYTANFRKPHKEEELRRQEKKTVQGHWINLTCKYVNLTVFNNMFIITPVNSLLEQIFSLNSLTRCTHAWNYWQCRFWGNGRW